MLSECSPHQNIPLFTCLYSCHSHCILSASNFWGASQSKTKWQKTAVILPHASQLGWSLANLGWAQLGGSASNSVCWAGLHTGVRLRSALRTSQWAQAARRADSWEELFSWPGQRYTRASPTAWHVSSLISVLFAFMPVGQSRPRWQAQKSKVGKIKVFCPGGGGIEWIFWGKKIESTLEAWSYTHLLT